jgi:uncharacterized protein
LKLDEFLGYLSGEPGWPGAGKVDVMARAVSGDTPLHAALWGRDDEAARELIASGADVNAPGEEGYTPLHVAVAQANAAIARLLTANGASWDVVCELGSTALQDARRSEDPEIRALIHGDDK